MWRQSACGASSPAPITIKVSTSHSCQNKMTTKLGVCLDVGGKKSGCHYYELLSGNLEWENSLHRSSCAVWYNPSVIWETIDSPGCYIRYIRALCSERTSNHSNELCYWSHSTVRESTAGFQDNWTLKFHLSSSFIVFVSLFSWDVA